MQSTQLLTLLHLIDSAFPTGAFSHSFGLETYTQQGIIHDSDTLITFLAGRLLEGMARFDLILIQEAMIADEIALFALDEQVTAMLSVSETREASMQIGKRFLKAAVPLYGGTRSQRYYAAIREKQVSGHYMLAFGAVMADMAVPVEVSLTAYAHAFVMGQAAAAVKLINFGQTRTQQVIHAMQPTIERAVEEALNSTLDDLHNFNPALDIRAMQHEFLFRRLFIS